MTDAFVKLVMHHWRSGRDTGRIATALQLPEHVIAKALRIGRDGEVRKQAGAA